MWTLTGFADEISPDVDEQLQTLDREEIRWLELRGAWGKNVLDLSVDELDRFKDAIDAAGIGVSAIGSPIGKIPITDPFPPHLVRFEQALSVARFLDAPFVRVFSFYMPPGDDPQVHASEVIARLTEMTRRAEATNLTLLHENEKGIFGDTPDRCLQLLQAVKSPRLRAVWDPANFVQGGLRPFSEGYALLRPYIAYVHVKDALRDTGDVVVAGAGDAEWPPTIAALRDSGFAGFFSLEPHLLQAESFGGFSGPELWTRASQAFKALLREQQIAWR
jgi:sugar phosphate isomerase/epimerase